jgi:hypothetical protein
LLFEVVMKTISSGGTYLLKPAVVGSQEIAPSIPSLEHQAKHESALTDRGRLRHFSEWPTIRPELAKRHSRE